MFVCYVAILCPILVYSASDSPAPSTLLLLAGDLSGDLTGDDLREIDLRLTIRDNIGCGTGG